MTFSDDSARVLQPPSICSSTRRIRAWLGKGFRITEGFTLPFRALPYAANLYYFVVAEKSAGGEKR